MTYASEVTADSPVAYWKLNETTGTSAADSAGTNTGTYTGSPTLNTTGLTPSDTPNLCPTFSNATLQYVAVPHATVLNPASITVEALGDPTSINGNNRIYEKGLADSGVALKIEGSNLRFFVNGHVTVDFPFSDVGRHHFAGTYDSATGTGKLYLDGALVASATGTSGAAPATTDPARIGQKPGSSTGSDGWNGKLDEVAVYSTVLSAARLAAHAAAAGLVGTPTQFTWKGFTWTRAVRGAASPFVNSFAPDHVTVDGSNFLHLSVTNNSGAPIGAEVSNDTTGLGYGTYTVVVERTGGLAAMHSNVVFGGLFTYTSTNGGRTEIDADEQSKWSGTTATLSNAEWQPTVPGNPLSTRGGYNAAAGVLAPSDNIQCTVLTWSPTQIVWRTFHGATPDPAQLYRQSIVNAGQPVTITPEGGSTPVTIPAIIPAPSDERVHFNLWVCPDFGGGGDPTTVTDTDVTIRDFTFVASIPSPWSPAVSATTLGAAVTLAPDPAVSVTRADTVTVRYGSAYAGPVTATTLAGATALVPNPAISATTADGAASAGTLTGFGTGGFGQGGFGGSNLTSSTIQLTFHAAVTPPPVTPPPVAVEDIAGVGRIAVEIGFTTDPTVNGGLYLHWGDAVRGLWDVGLWAPAEVWTDVTPWLQTCQWQRGATRVEGPVLRYEAGTASITLNNRDGRFHPLNLTGPYAAAGRTQVRPMVPVRIRGTYGGLWYDLWRGFADGWDITHPAPDYSQATVSCTDGQKVFGSKSRTALSAPVGDGELSGARVNRIAASAGWPAPDRLIDAGQSTLVGTTLDGDPWTELLLVQDTEIGEIYIDAGGRLVFKDRHAILTEPLSTTSQAIFGRFGQASELPYVSLQPAYDDEDIRNVVRIAREGGTQQEARDNQSVTDNLEKTYPRTDLLMQTDSEALDYARYLLSQSKDPQVRFTQITIDPAAQPDDLWPQAFARDFGDRITIRSRPPGVGLVERDVFIRGISGTYSGLNRLQVTWTLQPASRATGLIWDVGRWGAATSTWVY